MSSSLTPFQLSSLTFVTLSLAAGQILFKSAAQEIAMDQGLFVLFKSLLSWQLVLALVVYGVATIFWVLVLTSVPLSRAYPFMALGFAVVPLVANLVFGEALNPSYWMGLTLLLSSLFIIATS